VKKSLFTLLELLIVIAIIGILLTWLIPSITQAREKRALQFVPANKSKLDILSLLIYPAAIIEFPYLQKSEPANTLAMTEKHQCGIVENEIQ
jgi:prepilin-type N-terminal cleavage/methylation domain-containing protein